MRITSAAVEALQTEAETFIARMFEDSSLVSVVGRRVTCKPVDIKTQFRIKGLVDYCLE